MNPNDMLTTLVMTLLEPAMAGGMPKEDAVRAYDGMMEAYSRLLDEQPQFAVALVRVMGHAVAIASGEAETVGS